MAVNVIIERFRTLGTQRDRFLADGDDALSRMPAPTSAVRGWDVGMDLESAVDRLPPGARSVFVLHDVEGYKHEEIGTLLGRVGRHVEVATAPRAHDAARAISPRRGPPMTDHPGDALSAYLDDELDAGRACRRRPSSGGVRRVPRRRRRSAPAARPGPRLVGRGRRRRRAISGPAWPRRLEARPAPRRRPHPAVVPAPLVGRHRRAGRRRVAGRRRDGRRDVARARRPRRPCADAGRRPSSRRSSRSARPTAPSRP